MKEAELRSARESSAEYHKIHKRLVGPTTADRLMQHFVELTQTQDVKEMYEAGWAAAEAALVAKGRPRTDRLEMLRAGGEAWEFARQLAYERAHLRENPQFDRALRIETTQSAYPVLESVVMGQDTPTARHEAFARLLDVTHRTGQLGVEAEATAQPSAGSYFGLINEQNTMLAINRLPSSHLFAATSLARSDDGNYYPDDTHDVQVISLFKKMRLDKRKLRITPLEVKSTTMPVHYAHPVVSARYHMHVHNLQEATQLTTALAKEFYGKPLSDDERFWLDDITADLVNMISIYQKSTEADSMMQYANMQIEPLVDELPQAV